MRVGVIQSCYVPWRGYFDFIASVDLFVLYNDVAFSKGSYQNRNQLKFPDRIRWMTVPIKVQLNMPIDEVLIDPSHPKWLVDHERLLHESLESARHFDDVIRLWRSGTAHVPDRLAALNTTLVSAVCEYLAINTPIVDSKRYGAVGRSTSRLVDLLRKIGADAYLSGPSARNYLDEDLFRKMGIRLEYKSYDYLPYPQLHGPFVGSVSVLDLIANCGPDSRRFLKSHSANLAVV